MLPAATPARRHTASDPSAHTAAPDPLMGLFRRRSAGPSPLVGRFVRLPSASRVALSGSRRFQEEIESALAAARGAPPRDLMGRRRFACAGDHEALGWIDTFLIREPTNPHDASAVAVWSARHGQIGYLPRGMAKRFQAILRRAESTGARGGSCAAYVSSEARASGSLELEVVACVSLPRGPEIPMTGLTPGWQASPKGVTWVCHDWLYGPPV